MNKIDIFLRISFIFFLFSLCFAIASTTYNGIKQEVRRNEFCKDNGYDGYTSKCIDSFCLRREYRCIKQIISDTGIGTEKRYSGVIE